jgi:tetratricopeptide (TPR) repeat protein
MAKRVRRRGPDAGRRRHETVGRLDRESLFVTIAVCVGLLISVAIVFAQTLGFDFVNFDDKGYVYQNDQVRSGLTWQGIVWSFGLHQYNWHPLTWLSHMADYQMFRLWPGGHHLTAVLLHVATVLLLFLVLLQMTERRWPSAGVAAIFAVHPLHVESAAWVAERKDVLSGFFFVLTLAAYIGYVRREFSIGRYLLVVLCFALGLLAKPMVVTLPFVLLLLDYWPLRRLGPDPAESRVADNWSSAALFRVLLEKVPLILMAAASCVVTSLAQRGSIKPLDRFPFMDRVAGALVSYGVYLLQFVWPSGLTAQYPYVKDQPSWAVAASMLLLTAITAAALAFRHRFPYLLVGWLWYLGMLVPVIGLVQVGDQARADRYMYLPMIGPALAVAWAIFDFARTAARRQFCGIASAAALAALTVTAWRQVDYWRDSEALWTRAISCTRGNWLALNNLGSLHMKVKRLDEAIADFEAALAVRPNLPLTLDNLAHALEARGDAHAAIAQYQKALDIDPDYAEAHNDLACLLANDGQVKLAIQHYNEALRVQPDYAEAHKNLALILASDGQSEDAIEHYRKALQYRPDDAKACNNLGSLLYLTGKQNAAKLDEAVFYLQHAVEIEPDFAQARGNLAAVKQARAALQHGSGGQSPIPPPRR